MAAAGLLAAIGLLILVRNAHRLECAPGAVHAGSRYLRRSDQQPAVRMAPATAAALLLFGLSLIFSLRLRTALLHQGLAIAALLVGWLGISRYLFGGEALFAVADMSVHAACLILLLCAGALTLRTDAGIAALLASDGVGGGIARRLLPAAIIVPLVAGALTVHYERRATFSFEAAVAVFALCQHDRVRGVRVDQRGARRTRRSPAPHRRTCAAPVRGAAPAQLRDRARRHRHDRRAAAWITGWNTQAEKMFGWPRGEVLGRELAELIIPERHREEHRRGLRRYVETGMARVLNKRIEFSALHRDGPRVPRRARHHAHRLRRGPGVQRIRP